ncbi:hypothetical protein F2Q69_00023158 [Brassica cretica]|uniref:Uncharacterized protein n=1 Tax=Brassica cretica TaxID=69181 RepID=A0A8S9Q5V8_BRACR|nr:hypothetical protein F2Q69_00023158 [Brassica cretica]
MKSKPDLALDSSSIGGRVRSKKQRSGADPSESMDSSGSLLDLNAEVKNPRRGRRQKFPPFARIQGPIDRVSDFEVDEVPVYEGFFESGFRDRVPSLVAKVLYSYVITQLNGGERRYHLHPRGGELPVQEIAKSDRKRVPAFDGRWTEKFAFMYLPGFSTVYVDPSLGEKTIKQVLELPIERRQVPFLESKEASERCSICGNMSGSKGEEAPAEYKRALEVMSAKKAAPKKAAPSEKDDEVQFIKSKRQAATALASSSKKNSRASGSTPTVSPSVSSNPATVLANLNTKVFPLTLLILPDGDSSASIQLIQGDLLQAMSQLFHLGERRGDPASLKADLAELNFQLHEEKDNVLAKEKEIKALKLKVRNQDEAGALAPAENVSLREQLEQREEEVCDLRCAAETFDAEKTMAVSGTIAVARWELMREWLNHQTVSWDLEGALKQYKMVKTSETEFRGLPAPTFEGEPSFLSGTETEKAPEPVTDDPPTS